MAKAFMSMCPCVLKVQWHLVASFNELVPYQCPPCSGITITCVSCAFLVYQWADLVHDLDRPFLCQTIENEQWKQTTNNIMSADTAVVVCLDVRVPVQWTSLPVDQMFSVFTVGRVCPVTTTKISLKCWAVMWMAIQDHGPGNMTWPFTLTQNTTTYLA